MGEISVGTLLFGQIIIGTRLYSNDSIEIYRARSLLNPDRPIALKLLRRTNAGAKDRENDFRREAFLGRILSHPNLIQTNDFFENANYLGFAMEFAIHGSLADLLQKRGRLEVNEVVQLMSEVALGLQTCHSHDIIHLDIKPENILLSDDGSAKVGDFGIARPPVDGRERNANVAGTLDFLSPEYVLHGRADARADLYALGVVGYIAITGEVPFAGHSAVEVLCNKIQRQPPNPREIRSDCSEELSQIIMCCMRGSPDERYQSARELGIDLIASQYPTEMRGYIYGDSAVEALAA